ncbi:molybdopterin-dependent oxidoreductase [Burkholderia anthina]|uniref:molybdopterin-dependent oxidoreductase n=1 Tax=Burkholderia anthina TaxID=179879 RepID=UPI00158ECD83|nr:molybdopterin-dependent oxidoreductase [Burkholderia anthina]
MATRSIQTASHWGVYNVLTDGNGAITGMTPFDADRHPATFVGGLPEIVRGPLRIDRPYVRAGYLRSRNRDRRGGDTFVPVSWDDALRLVADELARVRSEHGNEAIYGGSYGWASAGRFHHGPSVLKRLLGLHGGYVDKRGNHSFGAALGVMPYILGRADITNLVPSWPDVIESTGLMVMFGGAATKNTQLDAGGAVIHDNVDWYARAGEQGPPFIVISPSRADVPAGPRAEWIPIRPHTDTALMLGLAHTLVAEGLHDTGFLSRYCEGFERFEAYLLGRDGGTPRSPEWAAEITGIPTTRIRELARSMAANRTLINLSWSIQRADHGEQPVWMLVTLAAMLGQIGLPGGGFSLGFGAVNGILAPRVDGMPRPTLPLGPNPVKTYVPVGRVADMLLHPGQQIRCFGETITFPDIRLVYSIGGNPFHHNANLNRFLRAWQHPETVIVHEPWWNPAARHADIVLPATTTMERNDILAHEHSPYWLAMRQVIEPVGLARNDFDILADVADALGFRSAYDEGRDESGWLRHMYDVARNTAQKNGFTLPDFATFWADGQYRFPQPDTRTVLLDAFRRDPIAHALATASGKIEIHSSVIEQFGYDDCPAHPVWLEPQEWLGAADAARHPLHLLSNQPATRLHSQLDPASASRASKVAGREPLYMHPRDAAARGLRDGHVVRVFNDRGAFLAGVVLADCLVPGVVQIATGAWYDPLHGGQPGTLEKHGNPNVVTLDKGTSELTQGSVAQTALVEVEIFANPPPVTAFEPPAIAETGAG